MEESSVLPPEIPSARRIRPPTLALKRSFPRLRSPTRSRGNQDPRLRRIVSTSNISMKPSKLHPAERPHILAPTPRRHLIDSSASQHWLHTPPLSPTSSRGTSPVSAVSTSSSVFPRRTLSHHKSFSALLEHEQVGSPTGSVFGRQNGSAAASATASLLRERSEKGDGEVGVGRRWVRWMHKRGVKQWEVPCAIAAATLVKLCLGLGSYSGYATPPMYGDYEAQRHWMELTLHLPFREWYTYDLKYWGLDYPPLTAYVSWICGLVASWINPSWVALVDSRGIETEGSKVFLRLTVVVMDALVYVPALLFFARTWQGTRSHRAQTMVLLTLLLQPALLLIDFGHFQYNSVMLGLTLLAMDFFATGQDLLGAVCFVLSLGFKQMALYYAPAIGSYLLAKCIYLGPVQGGRLFARLALVTIATFTLLFLPFLPPFAPFSAIAHPITRIFPFSRGLFEDKVANFWCASNVVLKWRVWTSPGVLVKLSTALTALGFLPSVVGLLQAAIKFRMLDPAQPSKMDERVARPPFLSLLPYALLSSSMSFFLFSFQVHEKSILLPLMPTTLLLSGASIDSSSFLWGALANNTAVFSMWPLLKRDGLGLQYIATLFLWNRLIGYNPFRFSERSFVHLLSTGVHIAAIVLHVLEVLVPPSSRYPDLFPVLNVLISTPVFVLTWLWSIKCGIEVGWALGGPGPATPKTTTASLRRLSESEGVPTPIGQGYRQLGARAISLGYAQSSRRRPRSSANSVQGDAGK